MSSAIQNPLELPELLDSILRHVPTRDLLTKAQLVSKDWEENIKHTPILRQHGYLEPSRLVPEDARYQKNELAAFRIPDIFGVRYQLFRGHWSFSHVAPRDISAMRLKRHIRGQWWDWMGCQGKWRFLQVALPSITKLRWEITRLDKMDSELPEELPHAVAELHFPQGLRVGDLWDLISSIRGVYNIVWPTVRPDQLGRLAIDSDPVQQWRNIQDYRADSSLTLVLKQRVVDEDDYFEEVNYDTDEEEEEDDDYTHDDALFQNNLLRGYFSLHNAEVSSLSILERSLPDEALAWKYTKASGNFIRDLTGLTQQPYEPRM
ncbi:hypothetical protein F5Y06DRAFT_296844 [Hypoxylon sp. FL0890]|nr:hypothetical protein F5Y06DRAFT_296844 [Hypoxylon sp. FL0890]